MLEERETKKIKPLTFAGVYYDSLLFVILKLLHMNSLFGSTKLVHAIHTCVEFIFIIVFRGAADGGVFGDTTVVTDAFWSAAVATVTLSGCCCCWSDDGDSVADLLSLLFMADITVDVVSLATAVAIKEADVVSLITICWTISLCGLFSTPTLSDLSLNSIKSTECCCWPDDMFALISFSLCAIYLFASLLLTLAISKGFYLQFSDYSVNFFWIMYVGT